MSTNGHKTAALQNKQLNQLVYLGPPKETNVPPGYIWKLLKCIYALSDTARFWYLTLKEKLMRLRAGVSKYDQAIFIWHLKKCGI